MEPKFCKDCKHFKEAGGFVVPFGGSSVGWPASCNQPQERDLVHGRKTPANPSRMREANGPCGLTGVLWESKSEAPEPLGGSV